MIFGKRRKAIYLIITAIATGLIVDDIGFIRGSINETNVIARYNATFPLAILLTVIVVLIIYLILYIKKNKPKPTFQSKH